MYGTQASVAYFVYTYMFENDVKMYGTQAHRCSIHYRILFENDVKMYGTQAEYALQKTML